MNKILLSKEKLKNNKTFVFSFQEHVSSNPPQTILPVDDFLQVRREVLRMLKQYDPPASTNASTAEEEAPPGAENDDDDNVEKGQAFASITTVCVNYVKGVLLNFKSKFLTVNNG